MSSWPDITHNQAKALASLLHALRGDWDEPGIMAALGNARHQASAPDLMVAAIRAAASAHNRTPAVIGMQGEHWRSGTVARRAAEPDVRCTICNQGQERCQQLAALPDDGHAFTPPGPGRGDDVDPTTGEIRTPTDPASLVADLRRTLAALKADETTTTDEELDHAS